MNNRIIKCIFLYLLIAVTLTGCFGINIKHDPQNGVVYVAEKNGKECFILVGLDPEHEDVVSLLRIWINLNETDNMNKETLKLLQENNNTTLSKMEESLSTYFYQKSKYDSFQVVDFEFHLDDQVKGKVRENAKELIEFTGLTDELSDNILHYSELKNSSSFTFKWIIDNGTLIEDVSNINK